LISEFINDLSTWYVRRSRDRIKTDAVTQQTLGWVLTNLSKVIAPIMPFISELIYQNISSEGKSVHLTSWPQAGKDSDVALENDMVFVRQLVERIHAYRKEKCIPVKQPLSKVTIHPDRKKVSSELESLLREEVNIKAVVWGSLEKDLRIELDTTITAELKAEGDMRELIRSIQKLRKTQQLGISERIRLLQIPKKYKHLTKTQLNHIQKITLSNEIVWNDTIDITTGQQ